MSGPAITDWVDAPSSTPGISFLRQHRWEYFTYADLASLARSASAWLADRDIGHGDGVAIVADSSPLSVVMFYGALLRGSVVGMIYPPARFGARQLEMARARSVVDGLKARLVVADTQLPSGFLSELGTTSRCRTVQLDVGSLSKYPPTTEVAAPAGGDVAFVQFTSGTTARPQGIEITYEMVSNNVWALSSWLGAGPDRGWASWLPMAHDLGLVGACITSVTNQMPLWLLPPDQFIMRPTKYLECFVPGQATMSAVPNFALDHMTQRLKPENVAHLDLSEWDTLIVGAERIRASSMRDLEELLSRQGFANTCLRPAYGLAEATLAVTGHPTGERWRSLTVEPATLAPGSPVVRASNSSVGQELIDCGPPVVGVEVLIVGPEGESLPDGTLGEILVGGNSTIRSQPDSPDSASSDCWVATGDFGFIVDGGLIVVGRVGDASKVRGRWVFAEAVDAALVDGGLPGRGVATVLHEHADGVVVVVYLEGRAKAQVNLARSIAAQQLPGLPVEMRCVERGTIKRTTSGKVARGRMSQYFGRQLANEKASTE